MYGHYVSFEAHHLNGKSTVWSTYSAVQYTYLRFIAAGEAGLDDACPIVNHHGLVQNFCHSSSRSTLVATAAMTTAEDSREGFALNAARSPCCTATSLPTIQTRDHMASATNKVHHAL